MMKRTLALVFVLAIGIGTGMILKPAHAQKKKAPKFKENIIGIVPKQYGEFKGITGVVNQVQMAFMNEKGEVFLFEYRGGRISDRISKIARE